jgi:hypothetical protein
LSKRDRHLQSSFLTVRRHLQELCVVIYSVNRKRVSLNAGAVRDHVFEHYAERGKIVMGLLRRLSREKNAAVIVVTHDIRMVEGFDHVYQIADGRIQ